VVVFSRRRMKLRISLTLALLFSLLGSVAVSASDDRIGTKGYALVSKDGKFVPHEFTRHPVGPNDVLIEILYSGICHSDIHTARGEWGEVTYPLVPGHEIAGRVTAVGANVTKLKVGDNAGVGCLVNACGHCEQCLKGEEQYCENGRVLTYAAPDRFHGGELTQGGYADKIVVSENFVIKIPPNADLAKVAPLLCAGVTTYSPLKFTHVGKDDEVAIAGFGGLGHLAVQYAVSFGAKVTVFDITEDKRADALKLGAVKYINVNNPEELKRLGNRFRVILSTIPASYDPVMYLRMLKRDGELVILGLPSKEAAPTISIASLVGEGRRKIYGSQIGGIRETQEVVDYSVANNIYPHIETIPIQSLDDAYAKVLAGEVRYRYVIDLKSLK
jgi:uncharacterized zinc-type alcohol dehydrogenase-like protein